jgi:membrane protein YdbS with pleckstrin-like domain
MSGSGLIVLLVSVLTGLAVNEMSDLSPWLARWLVRKAAFLREGDNPRAHIRAADHQALIHDRPGKLLKLCTAIGFTVEAGTVRMRRALAGRFGLTDAPSQDFEYASDLIAPYLFPTEKYRGEWVRHWINPVKSISLRLPATVAAIVAAARLLDGWVFGVTLAGIIIVILAWSGWRVLAWRLDRFVITNKRIVITKGVISRRVSMLPLLRVTDMKYVQSPLGRLLDYGEFQLESAGGTSGMRSIKDLPNPNELYLRAVEEMYEPAAVETRANALNGDTDAPTAVPGSAQSLGSRLDDLTEEQVAALAALLGLTLRRSIAAHIDSLSDDQAAALRALFNSTPVDLGAKRIP